MTDEQKDELRAETCPCGKSWGGCLNTNHCTNDDLEIFDTTTQGNTPNADQV